MALEMEAPPLGRTRAATSGSVYAGKLDRPEYANNRDDLQPLASTPEPDEDFDWNTNDAVVITEQPETAIYWNSRDQMVIRQQGWPEDDSFLYFNRALLPRLIDLLRAEVAS
jgi:hypothetical protein